MSEPTGPAKPRSAKGSAKANEPSPAGGTADVPAGDAPTAETQAIPDPPLPPPSATDPAPRPASTGAPTTPVPAGTQPLPAAGGVPAFAEAAPAGLRPAGPPPGGPSSGPPPVGPPSGPPPDGPSSGPPSGPPSGRPPAGPTPGGPTGPPPKGPGLWRQATSTTGGLIAVVLAAALSALLVLGVVATAGLLAVRAVDDDRNDRMDSVREDGRMGLPPGQQRKLDRLPQGPEAPRRNGNGNGLGNGNGNGFGGGNGRGDLLRGAMGLGDVQHGEFTVQQDGKTVVMTLQRGEVTKSSATSVTVKSADDFTATYVVNDDTRGRTGALAVGDSVLVVAEKAGAKAVLIAESRRS